MVPWVMVRMVPFLMATSPGSGRLDICAAANAPLSNNRPMAVHARGMELMLLECMRASPELGDKVIFFLPRPPILGVCGDGVNGNSAISGGYDRFLASCDSFYISLQNEDSIRMFLYAGYSFGIGSRGKKLMSIAHEIAPLYRRDLT